MSLWSWCLEAYAKPGVAEACLVLQDEHGQNVPLLLWSVWAEGPSPAALDEAVRTARTWQAEVLEPIRAVRRGLKSEALPVPTASREALRADIKAAELHAERVLLEAFEVLAHGQNGHPALEALTAAAAAWGSPPPPARLAALAQALT